MSDPAFIHLRVHSSYSLLEGAIVIKDLVKWCKTHAMPAVAIVDNGNLFGSLEFSMAAGEAGIQPILGSTLMFQPAVVESRTAQPKPDQLLAYAQNETGWHNLLALSQQILSRAGGRRSAAAFHGRSRSARRGAHYTHGGYIRRRRQSLAGRTRTRLPRHSSSSSRTPFPAGFTSSSCATPCPTSRQLSSD